MKNLELTVPPVLVFVFTGLIMWILNLWIPGFHTEDEIWLSVSFLFVFTGSILGVAGVIQFRKTQTTVHPMDPAKTSALVTTGVYRLSRNPMYLGLLLVLIGWSGFLMNPVSFIFVFGFAGFMNRFQIKPEEKILNLKFGLEFQQYKKRVNRWLG